MGFADVGNLSGESGADFAIQRDSHEGFAAFGLRGIKNHLAVGRKTGFFIVGAVGQRQGLVGGQLHQLKLVGAPLAADIGHPPAIRAERRGNVVVARESHPLKDWKSTRLNSSHT